MDDKFLAHEWVAVRRRSLAILPIAAALFAALAAIVFWEGLHRSEFGFLTGVLIGTFGFWVILEAMTVVRVGRLLRDASDAVQSPEHRVLVKTGLGGVERNKS